MKTQVNMLRDEVTELKDMLKIIYLNPDIVTKLKKNKSS